MKTSSLTRIYSNRLLSFVPGVVLQLQVSQSTGQDLIALQVLPADLRRRFQQALKLDITQQQKPPN